MKKSLFFAFTFTFFNLITTAQGLIFDSTEFAKREKIEVTRAELPVTSSLKKYTPLLYPQVGGTCVAHSFANARTILLAKNLNWTDKQKITGISFSPYYIYYRNKDYDDADCEKGLNIETAAKEVLRNGFAPLADVEYPNYYPFTTNTLCVNYSSSFYPPSLREDESSAKNFKIDEIYRVTSLKELKTALAAGMPVVLGMFIPNSFNKAKNELWESQISDKLDRNAGHALLAVGYDDSKYGGAIELMNSWGDTWGNKGFIWVKYKDYLKWFLGGYAFYVEDNLNLRTAHDDAFTPEKAAIPTGTMNVKRGTGKYSSTFKNSEFIKAFENK